jgi:hypothetical protein
MSKPSGIYGLKCRGRGQFATAELRALERDWYEKLAATGFDDIETMPWNDHNTFLYHHSIVASRTFAAAERSGGTELGRLIFEYADARRWRYRWQRQLWAAIGLGWHATELVRLGWFPHRAQRHAHQIRQDMIAWARERVAQESAEPEDEAPGAIDEFGAPPAMPSMRRAVE